MRNETTQRYIRIALNVFFLLIILWNIGSILFLHQASYIQRNYWQSFQNLKTVYNSSQYVNKHPKGWIPDETVNSYAGGAYIRGVGPHLIAPDTPPLGRYLIGLSAIVFNNPNEVTLLFAILSLLFMFLLGKQIFKNTTLSLLPIALVTSEPIFLNQLIYTPLLDIIQLGFMLGSFYTFNKYVQTKKLLWIVVSVLLIGCFMSTKFFITGLTILLAMFLTLLMHWYKKQMVTFLLVSPLSFLVLLATYVRVFAYGYSLKAFLGIQKWVFLYHRSQLILPFSIWPLLLLNRWYVWYGSSPVLSDSQWRFTWPLITLVSGVTILLYLFKKIQRNICLEVLMIWAICYILFFSFGEITSRYLVIYIPVLYIIAIYGLYQVILFLYTTYKK